MAAFEQLYRTYWYRLYGVAYRHTASSQDAEELVQALFEKIWKNRADLRVKNWGAFLAVSLRNLIIDFQRRQTARKKFLRAYELPAASEMDESRVDQRELQEAIESLLQGLPEKTQTIFRLSRYGHKSVKEIAGTMQLTEKAVEYHITKSIKLLRQQLGHWLNLFFIIF